MTRPSTDQSETSLQRLDLVQPLLLDSARRTEQALRKYMGDLAQVPPQLLEAMQYSLFAGGKRVRPALVFACGSLFDAPEVDMLPAAAAMECVHTFSLIHDDLPAMDDDDLRRGVPTNHKVFGEAMAILAGDALLSLAFQILTERVGEAMVAAAMVRELATATGPVGMIGGQVADILGETEEPTPAKVRYIHERKTAALLAASCRLGGLSGRTGQDDIRAVGEYGYHLGLAFQLADDALDATATAEQLGKRTGKDTRAGKQTMVRLAGVEATLQAADDHVQRALGAVDRYGEAAAPLKALAEFVVRRSC